MTPPPSTPLRHPAAPGARELRPESPPDQALEGYLQAMVTAARAVVGMDLTFLARLEGPLLHLTHVDAGPGAPAVRAGMVLLREDSYCERLLDGTVPGSVADVHREPRLALLPITRELGLRAYCGVPVHLPDGQLYGTLCAVNSTEPQRVTDPQLDSLRLLGDLLGLRLAEHQLSTERHHARADAVCRFLSGAGRSVVVQPIVELGSAKVVGVEALCRFHAATGRTLRSDEVFLEAHELQLGIELEQTALASALELVAALADEVYLSVNLSPRAVLSPCTLELLGDAPLSRLVLEVTEHEAVADYPQLLAALAPLRTRGMRLAVDDAGAGFASLQHIAQLLPDIVRLDVAFVRELDRDPVRQAAAQSIIGLADAIGATVVAEGIETAAERDAVAALGITLGQGNLLGRPLAPSRLAIVDPVA